MLQRSLDVPVRRDRCQYVVSVRGAQRITQRTAVNASCTKSWRTGYVQRTKSFRRSDEATRRRRCPGGDCSRGTTAPRYRQPRSFGGRGHPRMVVADDTYQTSGAVVIGVVLVGFFIVFVAAAAAPAKKQRAVSVGCS